MANAIQRTKPLWLVVVFGLLLTVVSSTVSANPEEQLLARSFTPTSNIPYFEGRETIAALVIRLEELEKRILLQFALQKEALQFAREEMEKRALMQKEALDLARVDMKARLESMNEIRAQLTDQATRLVGNDKFEVNIKNILERIDTLSIRANDLALKLVGNDKFDATIKNLNDKIEFMNVKASSMTSAISNIEGKFYMLMLGIGLFFTMLQIAMKFFDRKNESSIK